MFKNKLLDIVNYSSLSARDKFEFRSRLNSFTEKESVTIMRPFVTQLIYTYGDPKTDPDAMEVERVFKELLAAEGK
jgi:hypothetical protein